MNGVSNLCIGRIDGHEIILGFGEIVLVTINKNDLVASRFFKVTVCLSEQRAHFAHMLRSFRQFSERWVSPHLIQQGG